MDHRYPISLIHATRGRPAKAKKCQSNWLALADRPFGIEIITVVDADDVESRKELPEAIVVEPGGGCARAWNEGAKASTGHILIQLSDDWMPPKGWDTIISQRIGDFNKPAILAISDGHRKDRLLCMAIMTRARYLEQGYMFHPRFLSVYSDDFFTEMAYREPGLVIEAKDIVIEHQHPGHGFGKVDTVMAISNSKDRYRHGKETLEMLRDGISIGFTVWNRPDYLETSLSTWAQNDFSRIGAVHFFVEPSHERPKILEVIRSFEKKINCPVVIHLNPKCNGVLKNPWVLFDNLFRVQGAGFAVLAEDDFTVSNDAVKLLSWCSEQFAEQCNILAACCKNHQHSVHAPDQCCVTPAFGGNIWGTWRSRWMKYLKDTWDFDYSSGKRGRAKESPSGWDWNIGSRIMPKNGLSCVMPVNSRSYHIGKKGVHTKPQHYQMTLVGNFVSNVPDDVQYKLVEAASGPNPHTFVDHEGSGLNISTAGDIGDVIYLLAVIRTLGAGPHTLLLRDSGGTRGIMKQAVNIDRLVRAQSCIKDVRPWTPNDVVHWVSEGFRTGYRMGSTITLLEAQASHAKRAGVIGFVEAGEHAWLDGIEPSLRSKGRVFVNRTDRYKNGTFPWRQIVDHYGSRILFSGTSEEYELFIKRFGPVEFAPTTDLLDLASLIAGSELFIGNQSCSFAIAEGLKHPTILEVCPTQPDCIFLRENSQQAFDGNCVLPDVSGSGELIIKQEPVEQPNLGTMRGPPGGWQYKDKIMGNGFGGATVRMMSLPEFRGQARQVVEQALLTHNAKRAPEFFADQSSDPWKTVRAAIKHAQKMKRTIP